MPYDRYTVYLVPAGIRESMPHRSDPASFPALNVSGERGKNAFDVMLFIVQVAGIQDTRFQALMPDALHWLGVTKIHRFISMSDMKYDAIVSTVRAVGY